LLRDAGIEYGLAQIARPVLTAAGLSPGQIRILVVNDRKLNAFITDTQHIFINSGLILRLNDVTMLQSVIAHEAAHIANGHLARRASSFRTSKTASSLGTLLAAATALVGHTEAATGIVIGTNSAAKRRFFSHTHAEESAADQSGIRYLAQAGINPQGAVKVMEIFKGQEMLSAARQDPYTQSHPLSSERSRKIKNLVSAQTKTFTNDPNAQYWFLRSQAKLSAFLRSPKWTLGKLKFETTKDIRLLRAAVAYFRQSNLPKATKAIVAAIEFRPKDGYLYDLYGNILLKSGKPKRSVKVYQQAVKLLPTNGLVLGGLGRALLANGQATSALPALEKARSVDFNDVRVLHDLAVAYAKTHQKGMAALITAERFALLSRGKDAVLHAKRAQSLLAEGSGPWKRAMDIQNKTAKTN
ncbi:MAG: M48 family metalloprotease, partial [Paracoccaceae bacterium]|nr:M48 family metalloprotease [Paracoccaceae bacterium]